MRERIRNQFLGPTVSYAKATGDDLYIAGVNAGNQMRKRTLVWAGKLLEVMTFAEAQRRMEDQRFRKLRDHYLSPLHVKPIRSDVGGELIGYEHISQEHIRKDEWVLDLVSAKRGVELEGRHLILQKGTAWQVFNRDCCMLLENCFFAKGQGIEIDDEVLGILREAQPGKNIDAYAIFGYTSTGQVNGLKGNYLKINGDLANRFVDWLKGRAAGATS